MMSVSATGGIVTVGENDRDDRNDLRASAIGDGRENGAP